LRRLAARAVTLVTLLLMASSTPADPLTPVKLRVGGKEVVLKTAAVTDGREVYLPLEALRAFSAQYTLTRREETALVTFSNGKTAEIALARPGRQPMLPLSALVAPLNAAFSLEKGLCDIRLGTLRAGETRKREEGVQGSEFRKDSASSAEHRTSPQSAESLDGGQTRPTSTVEKPDRPQERQTLLTLTASGAGRSGASVKKAEGDTAQGEKKGTSAADTPPSNPTDSVQKTDSLDGLMPDETTSSPAPPLSNPKGVKPGTAPIRILDVAFEGVNDGRAHLTIRTSGKPTAQTTLLQDPSRLAIDIPNSTLEIERRDWPVEHPLLTAIHAVPGETPGTTRLVLDLARLISYRVQPLGKDGLRILLGLPRGVGRRMQDLTVVVDPGHGGKSGLNPTGCRAWHNGVCVYEKDLTLAIASRLRRLLEEAGVNVLMTRTTDVNVPLPMRARLANDNNADLLISIHIDSCRIANSASGTTAYYHRQDPSSRALAQSIVERIARVSGLPNRRARSDTVLYTNGLSVLRNSAVPATLIEVGYINNVRDRTKLVSGVFQQTVAQAIFDGIRGYIEGALPDETLDPLEPETD